MHSQLLRPVHPTQDEGVWLLQIHQSHAWPNSHLTGPPHMAHTPDMAVHARILEHHDDRSLERGPVLSFGLGI